MNNINTNFKIQIDNFNGSINEFIKQVKDNILDIDQIPIIDILSQYLKYLLENKHDIDLNIASKIITDMTHILRIKSEHLFPNLEKKELEEIEEEENDAEILGDENEYLQEYSKYQKVIEYLKEKENSQNDIYFHMTGNNNYEEDGYELQKVDLADLLSALEKVLLNKKKEEFLPVKKRTFTIAIKIKEIISLIKNSKDGISFNYFMENTQSKLEIIITFLALLELIYSKKVSCYQNKSFGKIIFYLKGDA